MKNSLLLVLVVVLGCSSCSNNKQDVIIIEDTLNNTRLQETRSNDAMETEPTSSVSMQDDICVEIIYIMPEDTPKYIKPETVEFAEIGQMEYFTKVSYERLNPSEPMMPDYWWKDSFIGADIYNIDEGFTIYEAINAFYIKEVEMPDGEYYGSYAKNTTNSSIKRKLSERSVLSVSTDGKYVLCQTPDYSSGKFKTICEIFHEEKIVDSDTDFDALLRRIDNIWNKQELTGVYKVKDNNSSEFEVLDGQESLAHFFFKKRVDVIYYDREKLYFTVYNYDDLDGFFSIKYGEAEAELLFLTIGGSISPDGKYYITTTRSPYDLEKEADEVDGYYIRNIETAKTAFVPTGTNGAELYTSDTWVSKDCLYSLYKKLKNRRIADN